MISQAPVDQEDLIAGYKRASSIKPVKPEDLNKVYKEYGMMQGAVRGQSDSQLMKRAASHVVAWWQKQQLAAKAKPAAKSASTPTSRPASPAAKPMAAKPSAGATPAVKAGVAAKAAIMNKPKPLTITQAAPALKAAGIGGNPPAYALVSSEALTAWINRTKYNRALLAKRMAPTIASRPAAQPAPAPVIPHGALSAGRL